MSEVVSKRLEMEYVVSLDVNTVIKNTNSPFSRKDIERISLLLTRHQPERERYKNGGNFEHQDLPLMRFLVALFQLQNTQEGGTYMQVQ